MIIQNHIFSAREKKSNFPYVSESKYKKFLKKKNVSQEDKITFISLINKLLNSALLSVINLINFITKYLNDCFN